MLLLPSRLAHSTLAAGFALCAMAFAAEPAFAQDVPAARRFATEYHELARESIAGIERQLDVARIQATIVGVALAFLLHAIWMARAGRHPSARTLRIRRAMWAVLALASIASFYRFSLTERVRQDMHIKDAYHYYVGGKYFPELGYGKIYECTLAVAVKQQRWWVGQIDEVRNLETMLTRPAGEAVARGRRECRAKFSPEMWSQFEHDLSWFFDRVEGPVWRRTLNDFGFNPSPIWPLLTYPITRFSSADALPVLVHIDTLLVLAAIGSVGWAFGFEAMGLAAIAWGTGFLWRYTWMGDAFLRQIWFATALIGVACLGRRRMYAAGGLLAVSGSVRLFPAIFALGYAAHALRGFLQKRVWDRDALHAAMGLTLVGGTLLAASLFATGQGWQGYLDFAHNTVVLRDVVARNFAGLPALLWRFDGTTALHWQGEPGMGWLSPAGSVAIRVGVALAAGTAFWRALRHCEPWEAAALGFALIPLLVAPTGYYFHFVVFAAPLAVRRPWVGVWLLCACLGWLANGLFWRDLGSQFGVSSAIAVALSLAVLAAMLRPPRVLQSPDTSPSRRAGRG